LTDILIIYLIFTNGLFLFSSDSGGGCLCFGGREAPGIRHCASVSYVIVLTFFFFLAPSKIILI